MSTAKFDISGLPDLQNEEDTRGVALDKVGISGYKVPFEVLRKDGSRVPTTADVSVYASLEEGLKGSNMSRFGQTIEKAVQGKENISLEVLKEIAYVLRDRLGSKDSYVKFRFPYFLVKKSPVSDNYSHSYFDSEFEVRLVNDKLEVYLTTAVDYMSLCPCSRNMSIVGEDTEGVYGRGAHNQRSTGTATVLLRNPEEIFWLEDIIEMVEKASSCPIYNTLKRPDEKYVTERSYLNPKFAEDVTRDVHLALESHPNVKGFVFSAAHHESIHQYDCVAVTKGGEHPLP